MNLHSPSEVENLLSRDVINEFDSRRGGALGQICNELGVYGRERDMLMLNESIQHNLATRQVLAENCDSYFSMNANDYINILNRIGFVKIHEHKFDGTSSYDDTICVVDTFYVFAKEDEGIILKFDTFGTNVNSADFYYNLDMKKGEWPSGSSGHLHKTANHFIGSMDAREALVHNLNKLRSKGKFLKNWIECPWLWFLDYSQTKGEFDSKAINNQVIETFPESIKKMIVDSL